MQNFGWGIDERSSPCNLIRLWRCSSGWRMRCSYQWTGRPHWRSIHPHAEPWILAFAIEANHPFLFSGSRNPPPKPSQENSNDFEHLLLQQTFLPQIRRALQYNWWNKNPMVCHIVNLRGKMLPIWFWLWLWTREGLSLRSHPEHHCSSWMGVRTPNEHAHGFPIYFRDPNDSQNRKQDVVSERFCDQLSLRLDLRRFCIDEPMKCDTHDKYVRTSRNRLHTPGAHHCLRAEWVQFFSLWQVDGSRKGDLATEEFTCLNAQFMSKFWLIPY